MTLMGIVWKSLRDGADSQRYRARSRAATPSGRIALSQNGDQAIIYWEVLERLGMISPWIRVSPRLFAGSMEIRFFLLLRWKFPQLYNTIYQKRLLRPKSHTGTFSALTMDLGTFSQLTVDFSPVETGIFGRLVLIPFHGYAGNPNDAI
jgi:hypothetical protein